MRRRIVEQSMQEALEPSVPAARRAAQSQRVLLVVQPDC